MKLTRWNTADLSSLRVLTTGSTIVSQAFVQRVHERGVPLIQVYGTTETCPIAAYVRREDAQRKAGAAGLPQVVAPGCLDFTNWWVGEVPERYFGREFYQYNVEILLMRTNAEEYAALGRLMGERLTAAKGPFRVLIPTDGWSQLVGRKTYNLVGQEIGTWSQPSTDRVFVDTLRKYVPGATISELPYHINDQAFADACVETLIALLGHVATTSPGLQNV